jgi:hypothetical protein
MTQPKYQSGFKNQMHALAMNADGILKGLSKSYDVEQETYELAITTLNKTVSLLELTETIDKQKHLKDFRDAESSSIEAIQLMLYGGPLSGPLKHLYGLKDESKKPKRHDKPSMEKFAMNLQTMAYMATGNEHSLTQLRLPFLEGHLRYEMKSEHRDNMHFSDPAIFTIIGEWLQYQESFGQDHWIPPKTKSKPPTMVVKLTGKIRDPSTMVSYTIGTDRAFNREDMKVVSKDITNKHKSLRTIQRIVQRKQDALLQGKVFIVSKDDHYHGLELQENNIKKHYDGPAPTSPTEFRLFVPLGAHK